MEDYVEYYKKDYCVIVPILTGHNINEDKDFESFETCVKELEDYYILKYELSFNVGEIKHD